MSRWKPDARGRLEQAAYDLFRDQGYEKTTVADIADRAGLTERTFFRHFKDKREVLFGGGPVLQETLLTALADVPAFEPTIEAVRIAVEAMTEIMRGRRALARARQPIVAMHADLQERDLIKRAALTTALAQGLQRRGALEPEASLAAGVGMAVFYVAFAQWLDEPAERELVDVVREGFDRLTTLASASANTTHSRGMA